MCKRLFDLSLSTAALVLLTPFMILLGILVRVTSRGPALFMQERVGLNGKTFRLYKFRTMVHGRGVDDPHLTMKNDTRVTTLGAFLRKHRLDEFPQLLNVLKGEMSFVGPRPEIPRYVNMFPNDYSEILTVRPGITDYASVRFKDEAELMHGPDGYEKIYVEKILPAKISIYKEYARGNSLLADLRIILETVKAITGL